MLESFMLVIRWACQQPLAAGLDGHSNFLVTTPQGKMGVQNLRKGSDRWFDLP
jgi:hypothetical protein